MKIGQSLKTKRREILASADLLLSTKEYVVDFFVAKLDNSKSFFAKRKIKKAYKDLDFGKIEFINSLLKNNAYLSKKEVHSIQCIIIEILAMFNELKMNETEFKRIVDVLTRFVFFHLVSFFAFNKEQFFISKELSELGIFRE